MPLLRPFWRRNLLGLGGCLAVCFAAGLGGMGTAQAPGFYERLQRPMLSPPGWVFGPVWTVLYALMAVAAFLVWRKTDGLGVTRPQRFFLAQLACNALWPWTFFAWKQGLLSCVVIGVLWVLLLVTILEFWRVDRWGSILLWPYLVWVSYAWSLNQQIYRLNRSIL